MAPFKFSTNFRDRNSSFFLILHFLFSGLEAVLSHVLWCQLKQVQSIDSSIVRLWFVFQLNSARLENDSTEYLIKVLLWTPFFGSKYEEYRILSCKWEKHKSWIPHNSQSVSSNTHKTVSKIPVTFGNVYIFWDISTDEEIMIWAFLYINIFISQMIVRTRTHIRHPSK